MGKNTRLVEAPNRRETKWKKDCPPSRMLIASNGTACICLCAIGPDVEYLEESCSLNEWLQGAEFEPGVHVIEISCQTVTYDTDYGREYDLEVDFGEERPATDEELAAHCNDEWPWDPGLWMHK